MNTELFKNKNFLRIWSSQILSQLSINIMNFLVLVHIFEETGSTIASSFIWVAYAVPAVILGPIAAAAVDMRDKRKILVASNLIQAIEILLYSLVYQKYLYLSYGVVMAYSFLDQFYVPAETAALPVLVGKKNLPRANGLFFLSQQAAAFVGFGIAGLIREIIGFGETMLLGTIFLMVAFFATLSLPRLKSKEAENIDMENKVYLYFSRMKEGFDFIRRRKTILYPFLFMMFLQISLSIMVVNLPIIGRDIIKTKPSLAGTIILAPAGFGALLGTIIIPRLLVRNIRKRKIIEIALGILAVNFTLVLVVNTISEFWFGRALSIFAFFLLGIGYVSCLIPALTFLQTRTPHRLMGRVFGNFWFITTIATLIPVMFSATIAEVFSIHLLILLMGLAAGGVLIISRSFLPATLRNE